MPTGPKRPLQVRASPGSVVCWSLTVCAEGESRPPSPSFWLRQHQERGAWQRCEDALASLVVHSPKVRLACASAHQHRRTEGAPPGCPSSGRMCKPLSPLDSASQPSAGYLCTWRALAQVGTSCHIGWKLSLMVPQTWNSQLLRASPAARLALAGAQRPAPLWQFEAERRRCSLYPLGVS